MLVITSTDFSARWTKEIHVDSPGVGAESAEQQDASQRALACCDVCGVMARFRWKSLDSWTVGQLDLGVNPPAPDGLMGKKEKRWDI